MTSEKPSLIWSSSFAVAPSSRTPQLPGDKLLLPPSALEALLAAAPVVVSDTGTSRALTSTFDPFNPYTYAAERTARAQAQEHQQQLPYPLTFRLVNPDNGNVIFAGIREFSAEEGEVVLSHVLREALGIESKKGQQNGTDTPMSGTDEGERSLHITVHIKELPKGIYVKLRPLEAGYDPEDWEALLEQHLRSNFTTLTNGEVLMVPGGRGADGKKEEFRFLVDGFRPEGDGVCIVDTDLEVDIEALNEDQARETLKRIADKRQTAPGTQQGSSVVGTLPLFKTVHGQVHDGYVDYEVPSWDRTQGVEIELSEVEEAAEVDLFVSPFTPRQRVRPREDEYVFSEMSGRHPKRIRIQAKNVELEDAEALWVSVHAFTPAEAASSEPRQFLDPSGTFGPAGDQKFGRILKSKRVLL